MSEQRETRTAILMTLLPHRRKLKEGKEWIFTPLRYATEFIDYQFSLSAFFFYGLRCFVSCQKKLHISTSRFSEHLFILYFTSCSSVLAIYHLFLFPIIYTVYSLSLFLGCCYKLSDLFFSLIILDFNLYFRKVSAFLCTQFSLGSVLFSSSFIYHS